MQRRQFISLVGSVAAWPVVARAQQTMPVIGFLGAEPHETQTARFPAFLQGLAEIGYLDGRNVRIEYRWAEGHIDRYPALAADLVRQQVSAIAALAGSPAAIAAKKATSTIPIVFQGGFDPVEVGLVASLSRPGGNVTGVTNLGIELVPKRLELMHELLPQAKIFGFLLNPDHPTAGEQRHKIATAAKKFELEIKEVAARAVGDFDAAFGRLTELHVDGLLVGTGQPFAGRLDRLGALAARYRMPAISESPEFIESGGLLSYAGNRSDTYRLAGRYVGQVLKGEKSAELPVVQSSKVEMIINLKVAKALGINIPLSLVGRADEVIE